jgi:hypothetical protein
VTGGRGQKPENDQFQSYPYSVFTIIYIMRTNNLKACWDYEIGVLVHSSTHSPVPPRRHFIPEASATIYLSS